MSRLLLILPVVMMACNTAPPTQTQSQTPKEPPPAAPAPAAKVAQAHFGDAVTAQEVALVDIAKDPKAFETKPFTTRGKVTAVCQEMGCWMEIKDGASGAHLRMHGHSFFIPKSADGRTARVQATVVPDKTPKACGGEPECAGDLALLQLDATGVELD